LDKPRRRRRIMQSLQTVNNSCPRTLPSGSQKALDDELMLLSRSQKKALDDELTLLSGSQKALDDELMLPSRNQKALDDY
jgi:hypothetical protein